MKPSDYCAVEKKGSAGLGNTWLDPSSFKTDAVKQPSHLDVLHFKYSMIDDL